MIDLGWCLFHVVIKATTVPPSDLAMASNDQDATDDQLVKAAVKLKLVAPHIDLADAVRAVGIDINRPDFDELRQKAKDKVKAYIQQHGIPLLDAKVDAKRERAITIKTLMKYNPEDNFSAAHLTHAMKAAGFPETACRSGQAGYQACYRRLQKRMPAKNKKDKRAGRPTNVTVPAQGEEEEEENPPVMSPLTHDSSVSESLSDRSPTPPSAAPTACSIEDDDDNDDLFEIPDDFEQTHYFWPLPYPDDFVYNCVSKGSSTISLSSRSKPKTIQSITTSKNVRNSSEAAHQERQLIAEGQSIRNSLYKAATMLYSSVIRQENTLSNFATADNVATVFNLMSGADFLSGYEIQSGVDKGNAGKSPPQQGRVSTVPSAEFDAFCDAVFSFAAIQQINSTTRSRKMELQSLVGEILNTKRRSNDEPGKSSWYCCCAASCAADTIIRFRTRRSQLLQKD